MTIPHATITAERRYKAPRGRVFKAWSDPQQMAQWFIATGELADSVNDFRVGGRQMNFFGPARAPCFRSEGRYEDIVENERIITTSSMHMGEMRGSTTLCTVEFFDDGDGTRILLTDQSAYYMGDIAEIRREGWSKILARLGLFVDAQ